MKSLAAHPARRPYHLREPTCGFDLAKRSVPMRSHRNRTEKAALDLTDLPQPPQELTKDQAEAVVGGALDAYRLLSLVSHHQADGSYEWDDLASDVSQ
jgi:hypothetical protein